jgi:HSP20 family protein
MLVRWTEQDSPFSTFDALRRQMDRLLDEFDRPSLFQASSPGSFPVSVFDTDAALIFSADLPGLEEKDFSLSLAQNVLTIQGERKPRPLEGYTTHRQERASVHFSRSFALPCRVDPERTSASLKDGVLTVTLPKAAEAKPRTIAVNAG